MQTEKNKRQVVFIANGHRNHNRSNSRLRQGLQLSIAGLVLIAPLRSLADGGTLRISQRCGKWQVSVFTSPEVLRAGPIDISVLIQDAATSQVCNAVPVLIELTSPDLPGAVLDRTATTDAATNKLFQAALFDVPQSGRWSARISLDTPMASGEVRNAALSPNASALAFDLSIAPPLPAWLDLAPWVGWPFAAIALFLANQWLRPAIDVRSQKGCKSNPAA